MRGFRELKVWEKSHQLTLLVYQATKSFPKEELFGLTSQIRRACSSIPANIAEGCGRESNIDFAGFLQIAFGSASELEYHLLLALDLKLLDSASYKDMEALLVEIKKMLASFIQKLRSDG
ncbi:MAG TPA: four helix bundle protein [Pyrinomonadaceae bacterium]|nr:four helix bundle protein [Pyrinomonadaceae bacterium]